MKAFLALITIVLTMTTCAVAGEKINNPRDMFGPRRGSPGWLDYEDAKDSICHVLDRDNEAMRNPSQKDVDIYFSYDETPFKEYVKAAKRAERRFGVGPMETYFLVLGCDSHYSIVHLLTRKGSCLSAYGAVLFLEEKLEPHVLKWLLRTGGSDMKLTHINEFINTPGNGLQRRHCVMYRNKIVDILGEDEVKLKKMPFGF